MSTYASTGVDLDTLKQSSIYKKEIDSKLGLLMNRLKTELNRNEFDSGFAEFSGMCITFITEHMKGKSTLTTQFEMVVYPNEFIFILYEILIQFFTNILAVQANIHTLLENAYQLMEKVLEAKQFYLTVNNENNEDIQILLLCYMLDFYLLLESNYFDKLIKSGSIGQVEIRKYFKLGVKPYTHEEIVIIVTNHYYKLETFKIINIINRLSTIKKSTYTDYLRDTTHSIQNFEDHKERTKSIINSLVNNLPFPDVPTKNLFKNIEFSTLIEHAAHSVQDEPHNPRPVINDNMLRALYHEGKKLMKSHKRHRKTHKRHRSQRNRK